jgi:small subunit ribosomal protein S21
MLIVDLKGGMSIEKALKEMKKKVSRTKLVQELRERKEYTKPSVKRRTVVNKAKHIQRINSTPEK